MVSVLVWQIFGFTVHSFSMDRYIWLWSVVALLLAQATVLVWQFEKIIWDYWHPTISTPGL